MRIRYGCGRWVLGCLFVLAAVAVCAALAGALVLTGEAPLHAPRLTGFAPHPNDTFLPTTPLTLTFDQPMDTASVEAALALSPPVPGTFQWSADRRQVVFQPDPPGYEFGRAYRVRLPPGIEAGTLPRTTVDGVEWSFSLPPLLAGSSPPAGELNVGAAPGLEAIFNYALDCDSTLATFAITPAVAGDLACGDGEVHFTPTDPLDPGVSYAASLAHVFLANDPAPRPGVAWTFDTAAPLTVVRVSPTGVDPLADLWTPVRITFNRPVVADSAVERFSLILDGGEPLPGAWTWEDDGATLVFQPVAPLAPAASYRFALAPGVTDDLGFQTTEATVGAFETAPMVGAPSPQPDAQNVRLDSPIRLPFTRPMDYALVEAGLTFTPALEADLAWEGNTLVVTSRSGLAGDTAYEVRLSAEVRDESGAPLVAPFRWSFETEPFLLNADVPSGLAVRELQQPLDLVFALPMDRASVQRALQISPATSGEFTWRDDDRAVTFQPDPAWLAGAEYEITLLGLARTAGGAQQLGEDHTWSFSTAVTKVEFGEGPNVQVLDAAGERVVQLTYEGTGVTVADFRLYPITPTQFLAFYNPNALKTIDTTDLASVAEWRAVLTPLDEEAYDSDWRTAEITLSADVPAGLYVLTAGPPAEDQGQLLIVLTEHILVLKRALAGTGTRTEAQIVAWDTKISSGAPVVSATVRLLDRDGTVLAEGLTGADGLLSLDVPGEPAPLLALSDAGGDVSVCGFDNEWSDSGRWDWTEPAYRPLYTTYSYTDRPIYRPGQTVYFEDWLRAAADVSYTLPSPDFPVTVRLRDARDNVAATQVLTLSEFGTVHGEFQLADEPMLGTWNLETEVEGTVTRQPFKVEEHREPEFEVAVSTPKEAYIWGEAVSVTVQVAYYFGQPVADAEVTLIAYGGPAGKMYSREEYIEGWDRFGYRVYTATMRTDEQGRLTVLVPTERMFYEGENASALLALEATVTDTVGQSVSNYHIVFVQQTYQSVGILLDRFGYNSGEDISFTVEVRNQDQVPVAGVELVAQILGWDGREVVEATAATNTEGQADFSFQLTEQGSYQLAVAGLGDGGRTISTTHWLWIYDPTGQAPWYSGEWGYERFLSVGADRRTYVVGDEAHLIILAPVPGPALLTFERGAIYHAEPVELISGANFITVPIRADYAPNIYVIVNQFDPLVADEWWYEDSRPDAWLDRTGTQLVVPMSERQLTVTLSADSETYTPGEEATFQVQVTDHTGQPVVAEVGLAVMDEAIYTIAEDRSLDPFDVFYAPQANIVETYNSLNPTRLLFGDEGPGLVGDEEKVGHPRRTFLDTAYWAPSVVTGADGRATITFTLPDNPAEWRALARAVTTDTLVGQATARVVVSQDIVVRPALPRFLVQGDTITLTAVVHNLTTGPVSATVDLDLSNLQYLLPNTQQVVHVPAGGSTTVGWPVLADEPGEARVAVRVTAGVGARIAGRDAVERSLPVLPLAVPEVATFAGDLTPSRPTDTITLTLPPDALEGLSRLEINLAPTLVPVLLDGLEYLVGYPYGCVEQTMSRVLPNAMVARVFRTLGIRSELLETDLPPMVDLGQQKLYGYQHDDGGWGWWYDDTTDVNQTTYVLLGLAMTELAGFDVDDGVLDRGAEALRRMLPDADLCAQAYGAYALAMAGQPLTITLTLSDALELDLFSQAALAIALETTGDVSGSLALLDNLREAAVQEGGSVYWPAGDDEAYSRQVMGSDVRTTALVADALARLDPSSELLPGAVRWLMARRQGQGWGDTQKTSFASLALSGFLLVSQELAAGSAYRLYLNDELWAEGAFESAQAGQALTLPVAALFTGTNYLRLELGAEGEAPSGRLYYAVTVALQRRPEEGVIPALAAHARSIAVQREYRLLDSKDAAPGLGFGDLVEVRLTLDVPEEAWYVVVDDPLPAGFEALNERLGTTSHVAAAYWEEPVYYWEEYGYNRKDVRDERVSFFLTHLPPGQRTLTYLVRATTAGTFSALPTQVYPLYEPEVWSRSESSQVPIGPR